MTQKRPRQPPQPCPHVTAQSVASLAQSKGQRLTPLRAMVLAALSTTQQPIGAYALLDQLNKGRARKIAPISLYRCLTFFLQLGVVVKIDRAGTFALCCHAPTNAHRHVMILCDACGGFKEVRDDKVYAALDRLARANGHHLGPHAIELHGLCNSCAARLKA